MIAERTAGLTGMKASQVSLVMRQFSDSVKRIVEDMDPCSMTRDRYLGTPLRNVYVPGLGKFVLNWQIIEAWQRKHKDDKDK